MKNKDNYDRLKYDSTESYTGLVNDTIERFKKQKMMKENVAEELKTENPRKPKFYLQSKYLKEETVVAQLLVQLLVTPSSYQNT